MTDRFLAGYNPGFGQMGIWLSKPGVNVQGGGSEDQFLLWSNYKNPQVVAAGVLNIAANATETAYFPYPVDQIPFVSLHETVDGNANFYPFRNDLDQASILNVYIDTNRIDIQNIGPYGIQVSYMAISRKL